MKLYDSADSSECYAVRLLLSALGLPYQGIGVSDRARSQQLPTEILEMNPLGKVPVLIDAEVRLREAQAILVYLAARYDKSGVWFPRDAAAQGRIVMWLAFAFGQMRQRDTENSFGSDRIARHQIVIDALAILEEHLTECEFQGQIWVAARHPTIADIACFACIARSTIGREYLGHPKIDRWVSRCKRLPGFIGRPCDSSCS